MITTIFRYFEVYDALTMTGINDHDIGSWLFEVWARRLTVQGSNQVPKCFIAASNRASEASMNIYINIFRDRAIDLDAEIEIDLDADCAKLVQKECLHLF